MSKLRESHLADAKFGKNLSVEEKSKLVDLIRQHGNVFTRNPRKPSQTSVVHPIITEGAQPVKSRYYRVPVVWENEISHQIQEMIDNDIIRPSKLSR